MFSCTRDKNIQAGVVDNALVVSFLSAEAPRVWRIDMGRFLSATFEIKETQGRFALVMKPANDAAEEVGVFADKQKALEALQVITDAMLKGGNGHASHKKCGWIKTVLKWVLGLFIAFVVLSVLSHNRVPTQGDMAKTPAVRSGMPVPADQFLGP